MFTFGCIKRGATAAIMDDSRPSEPVAKRTRLVTGCSGAEVHNGGDKESTLSRSLMWMTDFFCDLPSVCRLSEMEQVALRMSNQLPS